MLLGIDESGTGAWAGPFFVVGIAVRDEKEFAERVPRLADSKTISDSRRRDLVPRIREHARVFQCEVSVGSIRSIGQRAAWRLAIATVHEQFALGRTLVYRVIIDGPRDPLVSIPNATWEPKADSKYPSVMAAGIVAKTLRNDVMLQLHQQFPKYDWGQNAGYGVPKHLAAIEEHGATVHHRPIKAITEILQKKAATT